MDDHGQGAMFFFGRGRKRKQLLTTPLTPQQRETMHLAAPLTKRLPQALAARHEGVVQVLLSEKHYEGVGGLAVTDDMRLAVASQAALLQLREGADYYPGLDSVVLYPESFVVNHERHDDHGLVHAEEDELSGESWTQGTVVLAWRDVAHESREQNGYNVVLHEFAHQLDDQSGDADGTPLLAGADALDRWHKAFQAAFERHARSLRRGREVLFDDNAAESPAEFFATAVELFFEYPAELAAEFGDVHACLADWLELDPRTFA